MGKPCCGSKDVLHENWCPEARRVRQQRLLLLVLLALTVTLLCGIGESGDFWDTAGWIP